MINNQDLHPEYSSWEDHICKFCGKNSEKYGEIWVCNECQVVCFSREICPDEVRRLISEYLNDVQNKILDKKETFHLLEQKVMSGGILNAEEYKILTNLDELRDISITLNQYIEMGSSLREKEERMLLYRLMKYSEWISIYFENANGKICD